MWVWLTACAVLDDTPPRIDVEGPLAPVRVGAAFQISFEDARPGMRRLLMSVDGRTEHLPVPDSGELEWVLGVEALEDGPHTVQFTAVDAAWVGNEASIGVPISVDMVPPNLRLHPSLQVRQGGTLAVWIKGNEPLANATVHFGDQLVPMFPVDGSFRALLGIETNHKPGTWGVRVVAQDLAGNEGVVQGEVRVRGEDFPRGRGAGRFDDDPGEAADPAVAATLAERDACFAEEGPLQRWIGPLGLPVAYGRMGAPFGQTLRGSPQGARHRGMDLVKEEGARISAAAPGIVVLAKEQAIFGNVVILDHGHGVLSTYAHLYTVEVAKGDAVGQGDQIGTMGSTGQTSRPMLHWGMVVGGVEVEPGEWLDQDFSISPFRDW